MKTKLIRMSAIAVAMLSILLSCKKGVDVNSAAGTETQTSRKNSASVLACSAQGWASRNGGTWGGGDVTPTVVTSYSALKSAILNTSVKVIQVNGTIAIPSGGGISFQDQTNKTIFGSRGAKLVSTDQTASGSGILYMKRLTNVIIKNLIFEGPGAYDVDGKDNLTIDACKNIWVDHCEFRDGVDGNLDIKNTSDFITVSWTKFTYLKAPRPDGPGGSDDHRFSNLIGSGDDAIADRGKLQITFSKCWWAPGCKARMPRVRFGKVHIVNSYFNSTASSYCVQAGFEANLLVESNVFENVKNPIDRMDNRSTAVQVRNNIFTNVSGNTAGNGVNAFIPPYSISILSASSVKSAVTSSTGAGATLSGNTCNGI
ncbi:polysaccharide lyase family 1 protein [Paradesertivirga mongoliensis]|uniref:Polysaccharide lyase family 1 protein n=1 Tax=Paradesertivirga mongoliensis TaxID=2100740 RepID=A0ABW4ZKC1_9SPHI|nr:hypothetical protein [Pedobacter mongoliensis]